MAIHEISAVLKPAAGLFQPEPEPAFAVKATDCKHGPFMYFPHDFYIGGALERYGEYAEVELCQNLRYIHPGDVVIEAGANIGTHTVPMAKRVTDAGRVIAFEPQRVIYQMLCGNVALNALWNVFAFQCGLGATTSLMTVPPVDYSQQGNFGGVALSDVPGEPVHIEKLDNYNLPRCDFIKADVEGMEQSVLTGGYETIRKFRPVMSVENDRKDKSADLIEYLKQALGYDLYLSVTPLYNASNFKGNMHNDYGNVASVNMLCLPSEKGLEPPDGLPRL